MIYIDTMDAFVISVQLQQRFPLNLQIQQYLQKGTYLLNSSTHNYKYSSLHKKYNKNIHCQNFDKQVLLCRVWFLFWQLELTFGNSAAVDSFVCFGKIHLCNDQSQ